MRGKSKGQNKREVEEREVRWEEGGKEDREIKGKGRSINGRKV